jgi:hypothetical protein
VLRLKKQKVAEMIISKKSISRRTVLRGLGATLALPLLDSMVPAFSAIAKTAGAPVNRFGVMYVPNGMIMQNWAPIGEGSTFEFNTTMMPLAPFRNQLTVVSGLNCNVPTGVRAGDGVHARASTRFLTDIYPKITPSGGAVQAGISMDQILGKELGKYTQLASLEMAIESTQSAGRLRSGLCLRLHQHDFVGRRRHAASDGEQSARGLRAAVWRHGQHRSRRAAVADSAGSQPS